jgi:hypothetical protein
MSLEIKVDERVTEVSMHTHNSETSIAAKGFAMKPRTQDQYGNPAFVFLECTEGRYSDGSMKTLQVFLSPSQARELGEQLTTEALNVMDPTIVKERKYIQRCGL